MALCYTTYAIKRFNSGDHAIKLTPKDGQMNTYTEPNQPADQPILLSQEQLTALREFLPSGSIVLSGLHGSATPPTTDTPVSSVIVIYTKDDHTIHSVVMDEVKPGHYELHDDMVIGHW